MLGLWLPLPAEAGDLDRPFVTEQALAELKAMSAATVDRYLKPARDRMRIKGIWTTKPSPLLRNPITIRNCADDTPDRPGVIEADTVAHCGPTLIGEFARTLTMTDLVTGWTENCSIRNNSAKWIVAGVEELRERFPSGPGARVPVPRLIPTVRHAWELLTHCAISRTNHSCFSTTIPPCRVFRPAPDRNLRIASVLRH